MRRPSKFKNKRITLDGIKFMSKAEAAYYWCHIKPKLEGGHISHLEFQPRIRCEIVGKKICDYIADFRYIDTQETSPQGAHGCSVVVEVKGYQTDVYKLKMKLVKALYPSMKILVISARELASEISSLPQQE